MAPSARFGRDLNHIIELIELTKTDAEEWTADTAMSALIMTCPRLMTRPLEFETAFDAFNTVAGDTVEAQALSCRSPPART